MRLAIVLLVASWVTFTAKADQPNLLFILADDLSWSDPGCYGNELFDTPHLDRLASEGIQFTQAYSPAPICSASRASILTGNSVARNQFEFVVKDKPGGQTILTPLTTPPFTINLALESTTLPEMLAPGASNCSFYGKWHLNAHYEGYLGWSPTHGPESHGFDTIEEGFGSHPYSYRGKTKQLPPLELAEGEFPKDSITQHAVNAIEAYGSSTSEKPFFLMVSHSYVHDPVHTRIDWLKKRYLDQIPDTHPKQDLLASYGSMVTTLDHYVGELLDALERSGLADTTLVIFTSDNGGHPNYAGNAPLRGSKWNLYEGGIRVPFLVRLPGVTPPGSTCDEMVTATDLFATFGELWNQRTDTAHDSTSLLPLFRDPNESLPERSIVWHFPYYHPEKGYDTSPDEVGIHDGVTSKTLPHSAIRRGDWKLLHFYEDNRDELYHLGKDPGEQTNLASQYPDTIASLREALDTYLSKVNARLPTPNPDYKSTQKQP